MTSTNSVDPPPDAAVAFLTADADRRAAIVRDAITPDLAATGETTTEELAELGRTYLASVLPADDADRPAEFARTCIERGIAAETVETLLVELQARLLEAADLERFPAPELARATGRDIAAVSAEFARGNGAHQGSESASRQLSAVHAEAQEVTERSTEIESLTEQQSTNMDELSREVGDVSAAVEEIAASTGEINEQSDSAAELAAEGCRKARALDERIDEIHARATRVHEAIDVLVAHVGDINAFVDTIDDIAEKTNILALNASIEAARVDGGDGFAVVADEVKSLAADSQAEAARIRNLVETIDEATERVTEDIEEAVIQTEAGRREATQSVETFEEIEDVTARLSVSMDEIATATGQQAQGAEELAMMADEANRKSAMILEEVHEIKQSNHGLLERLETSLDGEKH